ncbi:uncharacterized protein EDB93DRAFT_1105898 [Suillus bovinus]|uniref:uncharacterized protein n=1 Tax=Suillus bovinus TaxID=48563 RepID=UPI001B864AD1|nr:uncharacterized protein EDB93DRAFT_1105898 [Suillus bovinus]KAG2140492.1 hypothetical protein EDB93DRAFT_1105898 [Suillus bovinus]
MTSTFSSMQSGGFDDRPSQDSFFQDQSLSETPSQSFQGPSTAGTSMSATTLMQQGKIPQMDVMHMVGLARLAKKQGNQWAMPPTPRVAPYPTTHPQNPPNPSAPERSMSQIAALSAPSNSTTTLLTVPDPTVCQTVKGATKRILCELFTINVMTTDKVTKKTMLTNAIRNSLPQCFGHGMMFKDFITNKHCRDVANTLLFPLIHSTTPPVVYCKLVIKKITMEGDGLVFMHIYTFDQILFFYAGFVNLVLLLY